MPDATIVKNKPMLRPRQGKVPARAQYPFDQLEVGDCLIVDAGPTGSSNSSPVYYAARAYREWSQQRGGKLRPRGEHFDFAARKLPDQPGKLGVWRIPCRCAFCEE